MVDKSIAPLVRGSPTVGVNDNGDNTISLYVVPGSVSGGGGGSGNLDGGFPDSVYGGTTPVDGGTP